MCFVGNLVFLTSLFLSDVKFQTARLLSGDRRGQAISGPVTTICRCQPELQARMIKGWRDAVVMNSKSHYVLLYVYIFCLMCAILTPSPSSVQTIRASTYYIRQTVNHFCKILASILAYSYSGITT